MKYVNHFALQPGTQAEYRRRHDEIWPEMLVLITEAGLRNYSIWNFETHLIEYYECDDLDQAHRILAASPVKARWDSYMSDLLIYNPDGSATPLTMMFEWNGKELP